MKHFVMTRPKDPPERVLKLSLRDRDKLSLRDRDAVPDAAFDLWLQRGLHQLFDDVAKEPIPEELLRILRPLK